MVTTITDPNTRAVLPLGNAYKYDQLNRLSTAISFTNLNTSTNTWGSGGTGIYANNFTYDANGNILTQLRKNESAAIVDSLRYFYQKNSAGKTTRNRLYHVYDATSSGTYSDDIDDMGTYSAGGTINTSNNYVYDESGRLIKDVQSGIQQITYRVDNKVKEIKRYSESGANMRFDYDAMGHRIAKHIYTEDFIDLIESTYYILDPKGNVVSTYQRKISSPSIYFTQKERFIYGSSRVGILRDSIPLLGSQNATYSQATWNHVIGKRNYELTNHLGNVLTVVSDKPLPHDNGSGSVDYFLAEILQASDYSAFGVQLSGRNLYKTGSKEYRMGFQGQEEDDEIKGEGNSVNYSFRMHDPRLGRFFAIDPLTKKYPFYSPYAFSGNRIIDAKELEGLEPGIIFPARDGFDAIFDANKVFTANWQTIPVTSWDDMRCEINTFKAEHAEQQIQYVYIQTHGNAEGIVIGPRKTQSLETFSITDSGGLTVGKTDLDKYKKYLQMGEAKYRKFNKGYTFTYGANTKTYDDWCDQEAKCFNDFFGFLSELPDGTTVILGGCEAGQSEEFLKGLYELSGKRLNFIANQSSTRLVGEKILDAWLTQCDVTKGWVICGKSTNGEVTNLGGNSAKEGWLQVNSSGEQCIETKEEPCEE